MAASATAHDTNFAPGIPSNPEREAYYGDLHLHTTYSYDVYLSSNITPDQAYRFARGEPVQYLNETVNRSTLPLDFLAVTDHAENMGVFNALDDPQSALSRSKFGRRVQKEGMGFAGKTFVQLWEDGPIKYLSSAADVERKTVDALIRDAWDKQIEAANRNYKPGKFTTFIGYEWTAAPDLRNLHRNVIFRGDKAPRPFTAADSVKPEDLWSYLERARKQGYEALAIPHNSNFSNGLMFDWLDSRGKPIGQTYAEQRAGNEPLVEIVQQKGQSETHPVLSPSDEFANFEIMELDLSAAKGVQSIRSGSYVRDALGRGLEIARRTADINPFKYGFVGASDLHTGLSDSSEEAQAENLARRREPTARQKGFQEGWNEEIRTKAVYGKGEEKTVRQGLGSPGLTGVWAEQNTRESIYAALRRKETFATSGTRLKFRFFGGWNYTGNLLKSPDWVKTAYRDGVPMGGDLPAQPSGKKTPTFAFWAVKDPNGANLDRIQVVKIWLEGGKHVEAVYDVALSDQRAIDPKTNKAPPVGNSVDLETATYTNTIGATELSAVWRDPHFDAGTPAVYYLRVLEIPTPRVSTIMALKRGQPLPEGLSPTIQERGWSSPIWHGAPVRR